MKQIIRLNAVETPGQRSDLGQHIPKLNFLQASTGQINTLAPKENLLVLPLSSDIFLKNKSNKLILFVYQLNLVLTDPIGKNKLKLLPKMMLWVKTTKIASVCDIQGQQITTWITKTLETIKAQGEIILRVLVVRNYLGEILHQRHQNTHLAEKMTKTKSWLNGIWRQEKQKMRFRHNFVANCHGNC